MDPLTLSIITGLAVNYFTAFTEDDVPRLLHQGISPETFPRAQLRTATTSQQLQQVLNDATGVIEANAVQARSTWMVPCYKRSSTFASTTSTAPLPLATQQSRRKSS